MKGMKSLLISLIVVLALSAFVAPISAPPPPAEHSITDWDVKCTSGDTIWTYKVNNVGSPAISNWVVFWCNPDAILDVQVGASSIPKCVDYESEDWCWEYNTYGTPGNPQQGIKIEYKGGGDFPEEDLNVVITLSGCGYTQSDQVAYTIKYGGLKQNGVLNGPVAVCTEIPEFSTIALPVASILGLLFLFNHRKRRKEY
jgi:hypothetical protein